MNYNSFKYDKITGAVLKFKYLIKNYSIFNKISQKFSFVPQIYTPLEKMMIVIALAKVEHKIAKVSSKIPLSPSNGWNIFS